MENMMGIRNGAKKNENLYQQERNERKILFRSIH